MITKCLTTSLLLSVLTAFPVYAFPKDSSRILYPVRGTVIRSNWMRIIAQITAPPALIDHVKFFYSQRTPLTPSGPGEQKIFGVGRDTLFPYEVLANLKDLEGSENIINVFYRIKYKDGTVSPYLDRERNKQLSIDRTRPGNLIMCSIRKKEPTVIDGKLDEWDLSDTLGLAFTGSCTRVICRSCWDKEYLYFAVRIEDPFLFAHEKPVKETWVTKTDSILSLWRSDDIELNFDPQLKRSSQRNQNQMEFVFNPSGIAQGNKYDPNTGKITVWGDSIKYRFRIQGTLNNTSDIDTGFILEAAIPWKSLGISARAGMQIGFDLFNRDYVDENSQCLFSSWSNIEDGENDSPSKWGTLVLEGSPKKNYTTVTAVIMVLIILILTFFIIKKGKPARSESEISRQEKLVAMAVEYMQKNLDKSDLSLEETAASINLKRSAFSKLFNQVKGQSFPQVLNQMRMEKAKSLLIDTNKQITEIAFEVGYKNLEHFSQVFKKTCNLSPSDFRKNS
jgi:AraC-like DNA-binding protein